MRMDMTMSLWTCTGSMRILTRACSKGMAVWEWDEGYSILLWDASMRAHNMGME